ncbi:MAG TPA: sigma-70 family RNA polymerase sigma factor [Pirellulales bacterium]|nr:sigma-70 family RNA polymerase sigma factor [Pirellulales bacterium]
MTTLIGAVDVVRRSPPASEEDRLDAELLAALDGLLSTSDMTPEQFWDAFREDERCAGIFGSLCREAARKFGLNAEAVLNGALYGLWRSLNAQDPHEWLAKPRQDFIAWFSGVVKNKVRNATRSEARCDSRIVRIDKLSREAYCLEHVSARPGDPGLVMDFFDAVDEMPEDLRAVFLLHDLPQPVGPDESRKLSDLKIAKRLRISVSTVKRRWCDAQAYLQRHLPDLRIDV